MDRKGLGMAPEYTLRQGEAGTESEALKAIRSGTLINTEEPASNMIMVPELSPAQSIQKRFHGIRTSQRYRL